MITRASHAWISLLVSLVAACDSDGPATDAGDGGADGDVDGDIDGDADGDTDETEGGVAPFVEPEPLPVESWLVGLLSGSDTDPILPQIEAGTFEVPEEGLDDNGIRWRRVEPGENGSLGYVGRNVGYAIAEIPREEPTRVIARADFALAVYTNGTPQPGDLYGSRRSRVPLELRSGDNVVIVRTYGWRGSTEAELFTTPDEVFLNMADLTAPDLVVGDETEKWLGVPVLNLTPGAVIDVTARVLESDSFEETEVAYPALAPLAVTQLGFRLTSREPPIEPGQTVTVTVQVESPSLDFIYERDIELTTVADDVAYRRTFREDTDGSVQYYGVQPPAGFDPSEQYALVLSLHGASVEAIGQAQAYSQHDWTFVVAPTNRRPFGFDWEEWGRFNALAALRHAESVFDIDLHRVYLTGHSMGGHGTWHVGVHDTTNFAVIGPSAGWISFYTYGGEPEPSGAFGRARAHSQTMSYIGNLANRGVYIIHGSADDNVPVSEGRTMADAVGEVTDDIVYHEEPGAGHWWDGDASPGADCVDWPPLFEFMQERTVDPFELEFTFTSPAPSYSPIYSFVTLWAAETPYEDCVVRSVQSDDTTVELTTENVRTLELDVDGLGSHGIGTVVVDGEAHDLPAEGPLVVGPTEGKSPGRQGPYNQVFRHPFCYVYPDGEDGAVFARHAAYLVSYWSIYGNGHACAMPLSGLTGEVRAERNLVYVGIPMADIDLPDVPFEWDAEGVSVGGTSYPDAALMFVFPDGERLSAVLAAADGVEPLLYWIVPFSSRAGLPDYLVWSSSGSQLAGFFDADWQYDPDLDLP